MKLVEQWRTATRTGSGKIGTVLLFPAIFFLLLEWQEHDYAAAETVQGIVLHKGSTRSSPVSYRFSTHGGDSLEGRSKALPETWDELQPGAPVTVEYKRDPPHTSRIAGQTTGAGFWWKASLLLGAAAVMLIVIGTRKVASTAGSNTVSH